MNLLISWLVSALVIIVAAYLLPGVHVKSFTAALVAALVIGIINAFLKPFLLILTLPVNIFTFGLFTLVTNALLIMLASAVVPGFIVDSFWWALLFGIALSIINWFIHQF